MVSHGSRKRLATILAIASGVGASAWLLRFLRAYHQRPQTPGILHHGKLTPLFVAFDAWRATRDGSSAIVERQRNRLVDLVGIARTRSPYYQQLYQNLRTPITDICQLPPVTKPELMAHFDEWVTDPSVTLADVRTFISTTPPTGRLFHDRFLVWTTSGSTGIPTILLQDEGSLAVIDELRIVRAGPTWLTLPTIGRFLRHGYRVAAVYATGGHFGGVSLAEWIRRSHPTLGSGLRVFSVQSPVPDLVRELNVFQPVILTGYATALELLAQEQLAGRLQIHPVMVMSTAEALTPNRRDRVTTAFGCRVWNAYAASEAAALAFECHHGRLHLNADWYILEPVDEHYQPVPPGQPSYTSLVTNLANQIQPIIRYDLGDSVTIIPEACPCGSPLPIIRVEGRTDEILTVPTAHGEVVRLLPLAITTVVEETPGVHRFQLIQTTPTTLTIRLEPEPTFACEQVWSIVREHLQEYLAEQGAANIVVERSPEPPRRNLKTGKFRQVWAERGRRIADEAH